MFWGFKNHYQRAQKYPYNNRPYHVMPDIKLSKSPIQPRGSNTATATIGKSVEYKLILPLAIYFPLERHYFPEVSLFHQVVYHSCLITPHQWFFKFTNHHKYFVLHDRCSLSLHYVFSIRALKCNFYKEL